MKIFYHSMTGNVRRFLAKTGLEAVSIKEHPEPVHEPFVMVTNTIGFGVVPKPVTNFLKQNSSYLEGVSASGNTNWGANFAHAADLISHTYHVPIILKFELGGTKNDVKLFKERVNELEYAGSRA